jgi:hypothetical protein
MISYYYHVCAVAHLPSMLEWSVLLLTISKSSADVFLGPTRACGLCHAVAQYLVWFERKSKHEQDSILLGWYQYADASPGKTNQYILPVADCIDEEDPIMTTIKKSRICTHGFMEVMNIGKARMRSLRAVVCRSSVVLEHKLKGKKPSNAVSDDDEQAKVLKDHFEYLLQLGGARATRVRVIATLVDGTQEGHAYCQETVNMVYLPTSFGVRLCYKQYMETLGYAVTLHPNGGIIVRGIGGKAINQKELCHSQRIVKSGRPTIPS